ncbi:MAG: hypothetical protein C0602_01550 [Denitrovibrio sp.]|nr:MAG: hypothetical protein C0602_01550 [Denitrovibrio sp.]
MRITIFILVAVLLPGCSWLMSNQQTQPKQQTKQEYRPAYWYEVKEGKQYWYPDSSDSQKQRPAYWYEVKEGKQYWYPK